MIQKTQNIVIGLVCLLAIAGVLTYIEKPVIPKSQNNVNLDDFAKCLTQNGAKMYGASWCSHCQNQKKMFSDSFQYVDYVECAQGDAENPVCAKAGITGYPTWIFGDNSRMSGELTLVDLSKGSGCSLDLIK